MLPYCLPIFLPIFAEPILKRKPQYRHFFLPALAIICCFLASMRYVIGFDYRFYESIFSSISNSNITAILTSKTIEPGYSFLNLAISLLGGDYRVYLFVYHLLFTLLVFIWVSRYSPSPWLSIYLFVTLQYFALSMNFLRQALAAAIILWIYPFLKSHRLLSCIAIILLASAFHRTALVMLPLCFLLTLKPTRHHYISAILITVVTYLSMDTVIGVILNFIPKYQHYLTEKYWQGNSIVYILLPISCFLFTIPLLKQTLRNPNNSPVLANAMFYSLLIQVFITKHFILERFSLYVSFFSLIALPEAANAPCKLSRKSRIIILLIGCFLHFGFAASQNFHGVYPYRGIWDKAITAL